MGRCGRLAVALVFFIAGSSIALGQEATLLFQGGGARDVLPSADGSLLYIAVYDPGEVVAIDSTGGAIRNRARIHGGPSSLALVGDELAVLCRAEARVAVMEARTLSENASIPVSPGTNAIVYAGASQIVALNSIAGEISVVDIASRGVVKTAALPDGIPVAGAVAGGRIGIAVRAPAAFYILDSGLAVAQRRNLTEPPLAIGAVDGAFVVATESTVTRFDASTLEPTRSVELAARTLSASADGFACVANGMVHVLSSKLDNVYQQSLPEDATVARWTGSDVVAWSPSLGRVWRVGPAASMGAPSSVAAVDPAASQSGSRTESVSVEPPAGIVTAVAAIAPAVSDAIDAPTAAETPPTAPVAPTKKKKSKPRNDPPTVDHQYMVAPRHLHLGGFQPYAPHFGDPTHRTFNEELERALDFGRDEDSLAHINFDQPLEKLEPKEEPGIVMSGSGTDAKLKWRGGVDFFLDRVHFQGDSLDWSAAPSEAVIEGSARLERGDASLTADRIRIFDAIGPQLSGIWPLVPVRGRKNVAHPLTPHGYKEPDPRTEAPLGASEFVNVDWAEPGRRLVADRLVMNSMTRKSEFDNATGEAGPLYFHAKKLEVIGPKEVRAEDMWVTTCDQPTPHYRIRMSRVDSEERGQVDFSNPRLQLGKLDTPIYAPRVSASLEKGERHIATDLKIGSASSLGPYINVAQWFRLTPDIELAPRLVPTTRKGVGVGLDAHYDYMNEPASPMFRSRGDFQTLYTTENNGYTHWYHRQELTPDTVLLTQVEKWYEHDVLKEFYRNEYENRSGPRSFASVSHLGDGYIATGTFAPSLNNFSTETAKLPEVTFDLFERNLGAGFFGSFDGAVGYYDTRPDTVTAARTLTVGRLSYDWNVMRGLNILPFAELEGTYYSDTLDDGNDAFRGTTTFGVTAQSRLQKTYAGVGKFAGFKHIIIPSVSVLYRPDSALAAADTPHFDAYDSRPGRLRIESTLDNIVLAKNAPNGLIWPVARLTLYQGNDLENEAIRSNDYELDLEVRPRPAWGIQATAETHQVSEDPGVPGDDFSRVLTYAFYDDKFGKNKVNGRLGFAYTESGSGVLNEEIVYGVGYRISGAWSAAFEQRYDIKRNELARQSYFVRHKFHDWEVGMGVRARQSSVDFVVEVNLVNFPEIGF